MFNINFGNLNIKKKTNKPLAAGQAGGSALQRQTTAPQHGGDHPQLPPRQAPEVFKRRRKGQGAAEETAE